MAVVVAFISQKGGVGKSTLARALGAIVAHAGLRIRIADLDPQQNTVVRWQDVRRAGSVAPAIDAKSYVGIEDAVTPADDVDLLIVDTPGGSNQSTLRVARNAHLVVLPTGPSLDDLYPSVLLFHELVGEGIPRERLVFALCRTLTKGEEKQARMYLEAAGYEVLPGALPERAAYREAQNRGRAITETDQSDLNEQADTLMLELMSRVAAHVKALRNQAEHLTKTRRGR